MTTIRVAIRAAASDHSLSLVLLSRYEYERSARHRRRRRRRRRRLRSVWVWACVRVLLARACGRRRPELTGFCVSELLRVWWSVRGCVCACLSTRPLCQVPRLFSRFVRSFDLDLARAVEVNRVFSCCVRLWRDAQATAARSALFVFGVCGCGVI